MNHPAKPKKRVVSALLCKNALLLILERPCQVGSFQGYWSCISGYIEEGEDSIKTVLREVGEETGNKKDSLSLLSQADPNHTETENLFFQSYCFLFDSAKSRVEIDWEHNQFAWVKPRDLKKYKMVPWFDKLYDRLNSI
jgi:8-oxo-dGTP pyrophosphatase MutT (NUDIX family)